MSPRLRSLVALLLAWGTGTRAAAVQAPLDGVWRGTLVTPRAPLRLEFRFSTRPDSVCLGTLTSLDEGSASMPLDRIDADRDSVRIEIRTIGASYLAARSGDGSRLVGTWQQRGAPLALEIARAAADPGGTRPAAGAPPETAPAWGFPLLLRVPAAPGPFTGHGRTHLAWELWLTDWSVTDEAFVTRLEVLAADSVLARYEGPELDALLANPFAKDGLDHRVLSPGRGAVASLWLTFEPGIPMPARLRHRVTLRDGRVVEGAPVEVARRRPLALAPPLRGGVWISRGGPSNSAPHRRALLPLDGRVTIAQRLAIDWTRVDSTGATFVGDPRENRSYVAYGNEVLAVADGVVAGTRDDIVENTPGLPPAVAITPATACGNFVVLDLGGGAFALYAHLQPGRLRVHAGDRVKRGQVLGLVGNSGNSQWPHLHFHVADSSAPIASEGIAYELERFEVRTPAGSWEPRRHELPLANDRVRFP